MSERHRREHARKVLKRSGYKMGGNTLTEARGKKLIGEAVRQHEKKDHKGEKPTRLKLKDGGIAAGASPKRRADKSSRGKPHVQVNVLNAHPPGGGGNGPVPVPVPKPVPVPAGGPGGPPPPAMGMGPPGAGGPPPFKKGGRTRAKDGGKTEYPIDHAAGGGKGRLEKVEAYGA